MRLIFLLGLVQHVPLDISRIMCSMCCVRAFASRGKGPLFFEL